MTYKTYNDILDYAVYNYDSEANALVDQFLNSVGFVSVDDEPYEFADVAFFVRRSDGQVLYAYDSGCSCPMPFEDTRIKDLQETTLRGVEEAVLDFYDEEYSTVPRATMQQRIRATKEAIAAAGGR